MKTDAPSSTNSFAPASPMPAVPPVMTNLGDHPGERGAARDYRVVAAETGVTPVPAVGGRDANVSR